MKNIAVAKSALRQFRLLGDRIPEAPTPERLIQAGGTARVDRFVSVVEVSRDGKINTETLKNHRLRIDDGPLERARSHGQLAPNDRQLNAILWTAGNQYRELHASAGREPLQASNYQRSSTKGDNRTRLDLLARSEKQLVALDAFGAASKSMDEEAAKVIDGIVIAERALEDIGSALSGYRDPNVAKAIAMHTLRRGLRKLAVHFGLLTQTCD